MQSKTTAMTGRAVIGIAIGIAIETETGAIAITMTMAEIGESGDIALGRVIVTAIAAIEIGTGTIAIVTEIGIATGTGVDVTGPVTVATGVEWLCV